MMKRSRIVAAILLLMSGCAADTMQGYIGKDIRAVELDYGPPVNQIDLGGGTRAYQWSKTTVSSTPVSAVTTTSKDKKGRRTTDTQYVGGDQSVTNCLYTFLTTWDAPQGRWIVTGFRQPSLSCAVGG